MQRPFSRTQLLLGPEAMDRLGRSRVAVFGVGGVGGYVVEALARSGIGALEIIDSDRFSLSNLNRQLYATLETLGQYKVDAAADRVRTINPDCDVRAHKVFFLPETAGQFDFAACDYVVDAVDTVKAKLGLVTQAQAAGTPIISAMGAGNKLDPTALRVADIYQTSVCPLARIMRAECRKRGIRALKVVYSTEPPVRPAESADAIRRAEAAPGEATVPLRRDIPGSTAFVPSAMGLIIAGQVVRDLCAGMGRAQMRS